MSEVYLNHAGTSWPKPPAVLRAVQDSLTEPAGRAAVLLEGRYAALAAGLGIPKERLLLTPGCTQALHLALADYAWAPGDVLALGAFEHLAVERPARALAHRGVTVWIAPPGSNGAPMDLSAMEARLRQGGVRLVAISSAANVTGALYPVAELRALTQDHGAHLLVDAAQTVGWLPLPDADLVAFGSHKGLRGPWGLGGLVVNPCVPMATPRAEQPLDRPSWCDAGSVDRCALAGTLAGLEVTREDEGRLARARRQVARLRGALQDRPGVRILGPLDEADRVPTVAAAVSDPAAAAEELQSRGILVSAGEQCAPLAHASLGTGGIGALRLSVGPATTDEAIESAVSALAR